MKRAQTLFENVLGFILQPNLQHLPLLVLFNRLSQMSCIGWALQKMEYLH